MTVSKQAFEAIKKALLTINPSGSDFTVSVDNYYGYDANNRRLEFLTVTDLIHDTGYPIIIVYRDAEND